VEWIPASRAVDAAFWAANGCEIMNVFGEQTRSIWMDVAVAKATALEDTDQADVVVIGSGIAGLSCAYELAVRGRSVIVIDRGQIGSGMTARTTAHLSSALDDDFANLIRVRGPECARKLYQSLLASINRVEEIQMVESIDCDFTRLDGYWILAAGTPASKLDEELAACEKIGVRVFDCRQQTPLHTERLVRSLRFPAQARFHPTKYLAGLVTSIKRNGGRVFANTCAEAIEETQKKMVITTAGGHKLKARDVIVATNSPVNVRVPIHTKQAPYRTYAIAAKIPRGEVPDALYWDTHDPYHYVRLQPLSERTNAVIIGGEDHKSGEVDDGERRFELLENWARDRLPKMGEVTHRWSGQCLEPADYVSFIGPSPDNEHTFIVSGDSGQGITNGVIAGMMLADLLTTGSSPWSELYDPSRKVGSNIGAFLTENITPLLNFAEYLSASDITTINKLRAGEGRVVRSGLKKIAACRDIKGKLHLHSASCTHLGCVVHWNSLEQCWDCPCHGSQFAPDGTALNGPAVSALAKVDDSKEIQAAE
jgi:glycine/D-amino acid oxidase-like deaminating enzyme/nitrite reductase/ring-hydroxylating ferredoxin subunit